MPPLIVENAHLDRFIEALDEILSRGFLRIAGQFVKENLVDKFQEK